MIPNQAGRRGDPADTFLRSADNCVILCDDCHQSAHAHGDYRHGAVAPPSWFVYSHGRTGQLQHGMWVQRVEVEWRRIATRR